MAFNPINTNQPIIVLMFVDVKDLASMRYFVVVADKPIIGWDA